MVTTTKKNGKMYPKKTKGKVGKTNKSYMSGRSEPLKTPELKSWDNVLAVTAQPIGALPLGNNPNCFNDMIEGTDFFQRVGRKVELKSLRLRGYFLPIGSSTVTAYCRMIVLYDAQPNAAFPAIQDVLQDCNGGATTSAYSHPNLDNRERIKILRDKVFMLGPASGASEASFIPDGQQVYHYDEYIKLKGLTTVFNKTNGGTIADITSGSLVMFIIQDQTVVLDNWKTNMNSRLRYYDV